MVDKYVEKITHSLRKIYVLCFSIFKSNNVALYDRDRTYNICIETPYKVKTTNETLI